MARRRFDSDEPKNDDELVKRALIAKIRQGPPTEELVPLVNAYAKIRMVEARIDKGDFMSGFEDDPPPPAPPTVRHPL